VLRLGGTVFHDQDLHRVPGHGSLSLSDHRFYALSVETLQYR